MNQRDKNILTNHAFVLWIVALVILLIFLISPTRDDFSANLWLIGFYILLLAVVCFIKGNGGKAYFEK